MEQFTKRQPLKVWRVVKALPRDISTLQKNALVSGQTVIRGGHCF